MRFVNNKWELVGSAGFTLTGIKNIKLEFNNNTPYIVYNEDDIYSKLSVMKFNEKTWETVGNSGFIFNPSFDNPKKLLFHNDSLYLNVFNTNYEKKHSSSQSFNEVKVFKLENGTWKKIMSEEFPSDSIEFLTTVFKKNKPEIHYIKTKQIKNPVLVEEIGGSSIVDIPNLLEAEKRERGEFYPLLGTVLDNNGKLKKETRGYFQSKGYSIVVDKVTKMLQFKPNSPSTETSFELLNIINDSVSGVCNKGKWGVYTLTGLSIPLEYKKIEDDGYPVLKLINTNGITLTNIITNRTIKKTFSSIYMARIRPYLLIGKADNKSYLIDGDMPRIIGKAADSITTNGEVAIGFEDYIPKNSSTTERKYSITNIYKNIMIDSINYIMRDLCNGAYRISKKGQIYNIDKNFKRITDLSELDNNHFYLTLVINGNSTPNDPIYLNLKRNNPVGIGGLRQSDLRIAISGSLNEIKDKYTNLKDASGYPESDKGYITLLLPVGTYTYTIDSYTKSGRRINYKGDKPELTVEPGTKTLKLTIEVN